MAGVVRQRIELHRSTAESLCYADLRLDSTLRPIRVKGSGSPLRGQIQRAGTAVTRNIPNRQSYP